VPNLAFPTLWALALGVLIVMVGDLALRLLRSRLVDEASARVDVRLSALLMERVLGMRLEGRPASVGSFAANLRGFEQVRDFIAAGTVTALVDLPFTLLFLIALLWISPWLVLPVLLLGGAMLALGLAQQARLQALAQTTYQASAQRNAMLVEALSTLETIKTQGAEGQVQARWEQGNAFLAAAQVRMRHLASKATQATQSLAQAAPVLLILVGVYLIARGEMTVGGLVAASMLAGRALAPAGSVVGLLLQYQNARTALAGLEQLMAAAQERETGMPGLHKPVLDGQIEFRNVSFAYPGRDDKALESISFTVQPGEHVALIGRVGSGKSTIQRLIMGLYQPSGGAVLLDGIDLRQYDLSDVRRNLSYVSQEVTLMQGTLRDNIAFGQRSLLDLLNAENEAYTAQRSLANASFDLALASARTQAALGRLTGVLGLRKALADDAAAGWQAGAEAAARCPALPPATDSLL
jgi:ATP-binding cassette subfamily C protein LapB